MNFRYPNSITKFKADRKMKWISSLIKICFQKLVPVSANRTISEATWILFDPIAFYMKTKRCIVVPLLWILVHVHSMSFDQFIRAHFQLINYMLTVSYCPALNKILYQTKNTVSRRLLLTINDYPNGQRNYVGALLQCKAIHV